jgi:hypothetical protein
MGAGAALADFDGDGWLDIYLVSGAPLPGSDTARRTNSLHRNLGDGRFADVTEAAGAGDASYGTGACAADFDNDGDADLYVLNFGPNVFYRNRGDGTFADETAASGLSTTGWSVAAAAFDYDRDGFLDLYVVRYLDYSIDKDRPCPRRGGAGGRDYCGPTEYDGLHDLLFRNLGDGRFRDVSAATGIAAHAGKGMGAGVADVDRDGWPDVFVSNDQSRNFLFRNERGERFVEDGILAGVAYDDGGRAQASMGVAWGDVDGDGSLDLFVPCLAREVFPLYVNEGGGFFADAARRFGLAAATLPFTGFGAILADFDADGWLDIFTSNGAVFAHEGTDPGRDAFRDAYGETALLLRNDRGARFTDVSRGAAPYFGERRVGRGAAWGDLWNDGRASLIVNHAGDRPALLANVTPRDGSRHWLSIETIGRRSNRDGIGARVTVRAGSRRLVAEVSAGGSAFSQNDRRVLFGLGEAERVDGIEVRWPSGIVQELGGRAADRRIAVTEPERGTEPPGAK